MANFPRGSAAAQHNRDRPDRSAEGRRRQGARSQSQSTCRRPPFLESHVRPTCPPARPPLRLFYSIDPSHREAAQASATIPRQSPHPPPPATVSSATPRSPPGGGSARRAWRPWGSSSRCPRFAAPSFPRFYTLLPCCMIATARAVGSALPSFAQDPCFRRAESTNKLLA
jgi:hypothetical protein